MKMMQLTDELLSEHYAHLSGKSLLSACERFDDDSSCHCLLFRRWWDAIQTVRTLAGPTNGRLAAPGTIRGDYSMSFQENIVHASDSPETAAIELKRFFKPKKYSITSRQHLTTCMQMTNIK